MANPQFVGTVLYEKYKSSVKHLFFVKYTIGKEFFTCPVERELQSFGGK